MTTPIDPGDTEALAKIAYDQLLHHGNVPFEQRISGSVEKYRKIADAVARAVCPVGYRVVADDDLRALLSLAYIGAQETRRDEEQFLCEMGVLDRLRATIGEAA